jgi:hypothetical protein
MDNNSDMFGDYPGDVRGLSNDMEVDSYAGTTELDAADFAAAWTENHHGASGGHWKPILWCIS